MAATLLMPTHSIARLDVMQGARVQLVITSSAGVVALLATTALSIYKPRGPTRYGWRR